MKRVEKEIFAKLCIFLISYMVASFSCANTTDSLYYSGKKITPAKKTIQPQASSRKIGPLLHISAQVDYCQSKNAQCGTLFRADTATKVDCPNNCVSGESCVSNRCEPICTSNQFDGPIDNMFLHMPIIINNDDLSQNNNSVAINYASIPNGWQSTTNFLGKSLTVNLPVKSGNTLGTVSFNIIPSEIKKDNFIMRSDGFVLEEVNNGLIITLKRRNNTSVVIRTNQNILKTKSCNHVAMIIRDAGQRVIVWVNGKNETSMYSPTARVITQPKQLQVGSYSGKIWNIRFYKRNLTNAEITQLAKPCLNSPSLTPYKAGYPNFLCGAYVCLWWPLDSNLEPGEAPIPLSQYQYYLKKQDEVFERHIFDAGMYLHHDICGFMNWSKGETNRNLILDAGIRNGFVRPYSEANPVDQYWLHENFHSFQGVLARYTNREKEGSKFLKEASASWGADSVIAGMIPQSIDSLLGYYTLEPHIALWADQDSPIDSSIDSRFKGGHQYGAFTFFAYISRYVVNNRIIGDIFNDSRAGFEPIAALNDLLTKAGYDMKQLFADFAAKTINFDYLYKPAYTQSEVESCDRMYGDDFDYNRATCIADSPKFIAHLNSKGTNCEWVTPLAKFKIGSWAYNVVEVTTPLSQRFEVGVGVDANNPAYTNFQARLVIQDLNNNSFTYQAFPTMKPGEEQLLTITTPVNAKFYLVVASTPDKFNSFETYNYRYKIKNLDLQ